MEKLAPFIENVKKHSFWIVLSLATLLLLYSWWISDHEIAKKFKEGKGNIHTQFKKIKKINKPPFPNDKWIKSKEDELEDVGRALAEVAKANYAEQAAARDWGDFDSEGMNNKQLATYWLEFLPQQMASLKDFVGASVDENATGKLIWNRVDNAAIVELAMPEEWSKYNEAKAKAEDEATADDERKIAEEIMQKMVWPNRSKVVAAQEIVWVYRTLLNSIKTVNEQSGSDPFNLPIRSIENVEVWSDADAKKNATTTLGTRRIRRPGAQAAPLPAGPGIKVPQVQDYYRVVPVRMELQMEHQYVAPLLVALANEALTCEVVDVELTSNPGFKKKASEEKKAGPMVAGKAKWGGKKKQKPAVVQAPQPRGKRTVIEALIYVAKPPKKKSDA